MTGVYHIMIIQMSPLLSPPCINVVSTMLRSKRSALLQKNVLLNHTGIRKSKKHAIVDNIRHTKHPGSNSLQNQFDELS